MFDDPRWGDDPRDRDDDRERDRDDEWREPGVRRDLGDAAEWVGHCPSCGYKFDLEFAAAALERLKHEAHVRERVDPCPACGAHEPEIHFACDTRKHTCFFVASCHACEHTFRILVRSEDPMRAGTDMRGPPHS